VTVGLDGSRGKRDGTDDERLSLAREEDVTAVGGQLQLLFHCTLRRTTKHTHPFNGPFSGTTQVSQYEKGKTNLDFTEARDSEWQWHQLGHMQVCTSLQTDNHISTPPLSFLQAGCPSCHPTNSVKALKANTTEHTALLLVIVIITTRAAKNRDLLIG